MDIDQTTYADLSLFHSEEEFSVFHRLNFTRTLSGRDWLLYFFNHPLAETGKIRETQAVIEIIGRHLNDWPTSITNGTIMVMERLYQSSIDTIPESASPVNAYSYRILHTPDYSLVRYSVTHFADFVGGFRQLLQMLKTPETPRLLSTYLDRAADLLNHPLLEQLGKIDPKKKLSPRETVLFGNYVLYKFKNQAQELINIYGRLDAWYSMAKAMQQFHLSFPTFVEQSTPYIDAIQLYHILLPKPVSYDVHMHKDSNFLFLTGANMAGKSTFIKAVGTAVFMAHLGMGVPAREMRLSLFDGILSNINVVDNIVKGESYFFNEVQRIKNTILKINNGKKWLVLIDELFKGTNVQDAMKCSATVIKGLIKIENSLFILSTHLYEIGEELREFGNISFKYFETTVTGDQLFFSYQLKDGISNDRLGYLILKREKVVDLLEKL
ncbi:MAG TPA: DNA mismatch repair protein MutS [Chitinophagaceae bacterium]